jgi:acyl carrier protein
MERHNETTEEQMERMDSEMKQVQLEDIINLFKEVQPLGNYEEDTLLYESGYVDSLTIFGRVLPELEKRYGIKVEPPELIPEHFETPAAILKYLKGKVAQLV